MVKEIVKQVIICDRCKKQLLTGEKIGYVAVHQRIELHGDAINKNEFEDMDFCEECLREITRYVACKEEKYINCTEVVFKGYEGNLITEETIKRKSKRKVAAVAPEQPNKKSGKRVDYGKILALANEGWDNKKIGEEMGMTPQQVSDAKWKAKKKQEAGTLVLGNDYNESMGGD